MRLIQEYQGRSQYFTEWPVGPHRLFVAVPCQPGSIPVPVNALLDTASEWCVLPPDVARSAGVDVDAGVPDTVLLTRFGAITGRLERVEFIFPADEGTDLTVDATCFVSADWPGPMVIGWKGCLERMRFALDPGDESFYFAAL